MNKYKWLSGATMLMGIFFSLDICWADSLTKPGTVSCSSPFGRDSTRSDLVNAFGATNVIDQDIEGHGGEGWQGTVIFPNDAERQLEILWGDEIHHRLLAAILIRNRSQWKGWRKVHIGMSLEEVEALNGKPFKLSTDFNTDEAGTVTGWQGGAMERIPGGCQLFLRLQAADDAPADIIGELEGERLSSESKVRSLRLTVSEIYTSYPK